MSLLTGPVPGSVRGHLEHVLEQALRGGAPEPICVMAAGSDLEWVERAACVPRADRARSVVAVDDEASLLSALRLGFGGALWMPPATAGMTLALRAAAEPVPCHHVSCEPRVASELAAAEGAVAVAWRNRGFWQTQLGEEAMCELLVELARRLDVPATILPWPALVVAGRSRRRIERAAGELVADRPAAPTQGVAVVPLTAGGMADLLTILVEHERSAEAAPTASPRAVYSLPRGERIGCWAPSSCGVVPERGWLATPEAACGPGHRWRLRSASQSDVWVEDAVATADLPEAPAPAVRVPGWLVRDLRPGSPGWLVVERLGRAAARLGIPLWVPAVCQVRVGHLLRLGLDLWVDGPCVPGSEDAEPGRP